DRGRDDRSPGRDHGADGCALAEMHVGHGRDVMMDDRKARDVLELLPRCRVDVPGPEPDRDVTRLDDLLHPPCLSGSRWISTRRFCWRPASVSLLAMGCVS